MMQLSPLIRFSLPLIVTGSSEQQIIILPQRCDITLTNGMRHLRGPIVQMIVIELQIIAVDKIRTGSRTNTWYNLYMNFIIKNIIRYVDVHIGLKMIGVDIYSLT